METRESSAGSAFSSDLYGQTSEKEAEPDNNKLPPESVKRKHEDSRNTPAKKRKFLENPAETQNSTLPSCASLPPAVWQNVFLYLSPLDLGRLLFVNRAFNSYLTKVNHVSDHASSGRCKLQLSEALWSFSRKTYAPKFPRPLASLSELDMLKLARGRRCQFCFKYGQPQAFDIWDRGSGKDAVRIIWAFGVRSCGGCLETRTQKDTALLISPASALLPGLPFTFITQDSHVVPASIIHQASSIPPHIQLKKCYYTLQLEQIQKELVEVQALGSAAAEEWFKGLETRGKARASDAERCERWESGNDRVHASQPSINPQFTASSPNMDHVYTLPAGQPSSMEQRTWGGPHQAPIYSPVPLGPFNPPIHPYPYHYTHAPQPLPQPPPQYVATSHTPTYSQPYAPPPTATQQQQRQDRSFRDVHEAKAARRADIERRCAELDPPILPNILRHMDSYKAALLITTAMTDHGWELLKPRLIAQRESAEEREKQDVAQKASVQTKASDRRTHEIGQREMKDLLDREWDEAQKPIRNQLGAYADEIISSVQWDHGRSVTHSNSPQFAATVLLHVRDRFFEENPRGGKESPENETGSTNTSGRKLILENMKWVFDHKIKHLTERYRKELFLCSACDSNYKYYGFEGVMQHFGAKHTNSFSVGNVVVSWKEAEWPEESPFMPDPSAAKTGQFQGASGAPGYGTYNQAANSRQASTTPQMFHMQRPLSQTSPMAFADGPFHPPPQIPGYGYDPAMQQRPMSSGVNGQYFQNPPGSMAAHQGLPFVVPHPHQGQPFPAPAMGQSHPIPYLQTAPVQPYQPVDPTSVTDSLNGKSPAHPTPPLFSDEQVSYLVRAFIDIWSTLSGVKALSNSVRLYVTISVAASSFRIRFGLEPALDLFIHALEHDPLLSPHKTAAGLDCKLCPSLDVSHKHPLGFPVFDDGFGFSVLSLASHFKKTHEANGPSPQEPGSESGPSWSKDMVALPTVTFITDLENAEGMDDRKLAIIGEAFPELFSKKPVSDSMPEPEPAPAPDTAKTKEVKTPGRPDKVGPVIGESGDDYSPQPMSPPIGPDEYDPRRPGLDPSAKSYSRENLRRRPVRVSPGHDEYRRPYYYVSRGPYEEDFMPRHQRGYYSDEGSWIPIRSGSPTYRPYQERHSSGRHEAEQARPRSPRIVEPVPDRRLPSGQSFNRPNVLDMDEEAVAENSKQKTPLKSPTSPTGTEGEAEKFLNGILVGDDLERYRKMAEDRDRQREEALRAKWEAERRDEQPDVEPGFNSSRRHPDDMTTVHSRTASGPSSHSRGRRWDDYLSNAHSPDFRTDYRHRSGSYRRRDRYAEPMYIPQSRVNRYTRVRRELEDPQYYGQRTARPQSRYDRYEDVRRQLERSVSPQRRPSEMPPEHYRDRSMDPRASSQVSPHEPTPFVDDGYSPAPPFVRYRYAEPPPPTYYDEYGRPVEMIRVHEPYTHHRPHQPHRYVPGPPYEPGPYQYEYVSSERGRREEQVYYEPGTGMPYPPERRPPPPASERDAMSYEPEARIKPEPTATPASFVVEQP